MTKEEQRIAIANALYKRAENTINPKWIIDGDEYYMEDLPDFLNDLNAIHQAERLCLMSGPLMMKYFEILDGFFMHSGETMLADASQRAEAFLKVMNLWKEDSTL